MRTMSFYKLVIAGPPAQLKDFEDQPPCRLQDFFGIRS